MLQQPVPTLTRTLPLTLHLACICQVLQQLVKAQREDVKAIIEEEARQIDHLKEKLDAEV